MAMLKFRRGLYSQITDQVNNPLANGTVYIATDEKAMYVDTATERIRIGDFIRVDTVKDITPPYSTSSLYYVEADNALLKYVETEVEGVKTGTWKQVNGTDDLQSALSALGERVSTLEGTVGSAASGLVKDVADLKTTVGNADAGLVKDVAAQATDIANLKKAVGMGEDGEVEGIGATVAQLSEDLDALELEVHGTDGNGGMVATLADHTSRIGDLETESAKHALKTDLDAYAKTADIQGTLNKVDTDKKVSEAIADAVAAEAAIARAAEEANANGVSQAKADAKAADDKAVAAGEAAAAADAKAVAADAKAETRLLKTDFEAFKITNTAAIEDADGKAVAAGEAAAAANANANTRVLTTDFNSFKESNTAAIADAKKAGTDAANAFNAYSEAHKNDYDNDTIDAKVKTASDAAATAQARADSAYSLAEAAVTDADLSDAIKDFATTSYVDQAEADAVVESTRLGNLAYAPISLVETVTSINGTIGNAEGGLVKDIADAKQAAEDANDNANTRVLTSDFNAFKTTNSAAIANAQTAADNAGTQAETNRQAIATLTATVDKLDGDVDTDGSVKKQIKDAADAIKTELSAEIDADINAANAMTFKGTVGSESALTGIEVSGTVKIGDTYVVSEAFGNYQAGDFLIAKSLTEAEDENGYIAADDIDWNHVKSGYDASLDQKLTGADNAIKLSNSVGNPDTQVAFVATGSASVEVKNNTVTIGMVWDDFE